VRVSAGVAVWVSGGRRAAVLKDELASRSMPRQPAKRGSGRDADGSSGVLDPPVFAARPADEQGSTLRRQAGIVVDVHPGLLRAAVERCRNHSFTRPP